jgi:hypothetical protein
VIYSPPLLARSDFLIGPLSSQSIGTAIWNMGQVTISTPGAAAWPTASMVLYTPFWVPESVTINRLLWVNGAVAGNVDVGVYAEDGTLLVSAGSTAISGANVIQSVDVTDTGLRRGRYYTAMVADTVTTLTIGCYNPAAGICQAVGMLQQASVTLPLSTNASPATFAKYTQAYIPMLFVLGHRTFAG